MVNEFFTDGVNAALVGAVSGAFLAGIVTFLVTSFLNNRTEMISVRARDSRALLLLIQFKSHATKFKEAKGIIGINRALAAIESNLKAIEPYVLNSRVPSYLGYFLTIRSNHAMLSIAPENITRNEWTNFCQQISDLATVILSTTSKPS